MPQISIITVNYNDAAGLERTIKSVQEQTANDYDHIIIDGNSNDGSKEVIEKHKDSFSYWVSESDEGVYNAMNKGIKAATGEYLLFLNSGDHFKGNNSLSQLAGGAAGLKPIALIYGNIEVVAENTSVKTYPEKLSLDYFVKDSLPHPATLIHRSCFHNYLYDTSLNIVADWKFFILGVVNNDFSYTHINKVISVFYYDGISSLQHDKISKERKKVIAYYFPNKLKLHYNYYPYKWVSRYNKWKNKCHSILKKVKNKIKNA